MSIENQHVKNEHLFAIKGWNYVANIMCVKGLVGAKKWKFLHFVAMFWLLKLSWPMIDFKSMKMLFHFLKVKNMPHKHYMIPWVGRWQKQCIALSCNPYKLLSKRLNTSLLVVTKSSQSTNLGVLCMHTLLVASRKCHCWWILRGCLPKALLITYPIDIEVVNAIRGLNSRKSSKQDKVDVSTSTLYRLYNYHKIAWN